MNYPLTQENFDYIKTWDTSKVTDMSNLFNGSNLPATISLEGLDMSNVTSASNMFANNNEIKYINVDGLRADKLGWNFIDAILSASTEKIDFSKNDTPMTYSYTYSTSGNYSTNLYSGYPNLTELRIPNAV